jgi:hypothetical protein
MSNVTVPKKSPLHKFTNALCCPRLQKFTTDGGTMIKVEVRCGADLVMTSIFDEPVLTLEQAMARVTSYVTEERMHEEGALAVRAVFCMPVAVAR